MHIIFSNRRNAVPTETVIYQFKNEKLFFDPEHIFKIEQFYVCLSLK